MVETLVQELKFYELGPMELMWNNQSTLCLFSVKISMLILGVTTIISCCLLFLNMLAGVVTPKQKLTKRRF